MEGVCEDVVRAIYRFDPVLDRLHVYQGIVCHRRVEVYPGPCDVEEREVEVVAQPVGVHMIAGVPHEAQPVALGNRYRGGVEKPHVMLHVAEHHRVQDVSGFDSEAAAYAHSRLLANGHVLYVANGLNLCFLYIGAGDEDGFSEG